MKLFSLDINDARQASLTRRRKLSPFKICNFLVKKLFASWKRKSDWVRYYVFLFVFINFPNPSPTRYVSERIRKLNQPKFIKKKKGKNLLIDFFWLNQFTPVFKKRKFNQIPNPKLSHLQNLDFTNYDHGRLGGTPSCWWRWKRRWNWVSTNLVISWLVEKEKKNEGRDEVTVIFNLKDSTCHPWKMLLSGLANRPQALFSLSLIHNPILLPSPSSCAIQNSANVLLLPYRFKPTLEKKKCELLLPRVVILMVVCRGGYKKWMTFLPLKAVRKKKWRKSS